MADETGDFRFAGAFVELNVKDNTEAGMEEARAKIEDSEPAKIPVKVDDKSVEDTKVRVKEETTRIGDESPVKTKIELDDKSVAEFEAKVQSLSDSAGNAGGGAGLGRGGLIAAGVGVGAGPIAAAGMLAIPAIFGAIGIAAEKSNADVQAATSGMTSAAKAALTQGFAPMVPAIVDVENQAKTAITGLEPVFAQVSTAAAPLLTTMSSGLISAVQAGVGASVPLLQTLKPEAQAVADGFGQVERGAMGFFSALNPGEAASGLKTLFGDIEDILPAVGHLVDDIMPLGNAILGVVGPAVKDLSTDFTVLRPVLDAAGSVISFLGPALAAVAPPALALMGVTKLLGNSWTDFSGAASKVKSVMQDADGEFDKGRSTLDNLAAAVGITTKNAKGQAIADAEAAVAKADLTKATAEQAVAEAEAAVASGGGAKAALEQMTADEALSVAAKSAAEAQAALDAASEASTFAMGPLGIAIGVVGGALTLMGLDSSKATAPTTDLTSDLVKLGQAAPGAAQGILAGNTALQGVVNEAPKAGVNVQAMLSAYAQGPAALQSFTDGVQKGNDALGNTRITVGGAHQTIKEYHDEISSGKTIRDEFTADELRQIDAYSAGNDVLGQLHTGVKDLTEAQQANENVTGGSAEATQLSASQQKQATGIAQALGLSISQVSTAYQHLVGGQQYAMTAGEKMADSFITQTLAVGTANSTISTYFQQSGQAAQQAAQSYSDANHSYAQSVTAVADAQHSYQQSITAVSDAQHSYAQSQLAVETADQGVVTAQRSVQDALANVGIAQDNVTKAEVADQQALDNLNVARQTAIEQLKTLHLQLADQVTSEESARLALFDQQNTSAALGVNAANAKTIAGETVTSTNEAQVKSAIDLLKAEQALADTLNTGANLRTQVNQADKAGVEGAPGVVSANQAVASANDQVVSAEQALVKAEQAVGDAEANVTKAKQGVTDALYNEGKASQAVKDAMYNEAKAHQSVSDALYAKEKAIQAVTQAQQQLKTAQDNASLSTDITTAAGQRNLAMIQKVHDQLMANEPQVQASNDLIKATAPLFHGSTDAAQAYLTKLALIPQNFRFSLTGVAGADLTALDSVYGQRYVGQQPNRRGLPGYAHGGLLGGVGGPRDDKNIIAASPGEYMVNADSTAKHFPLLEAINKPGGLRGYANGGQVTEVDKALNLDAFGSEFETGADLLWAMGLTGPNGLPAYVAPPPTAVPGIPSSRAANVAAMQAVFTQHGWGSGAEWNAAVTLEMMEAGFNNTAQNPTSTAYGMGQFLDSTWASYGIAKTSDPSLQSEAMARYIGSRYGDPLGALTHEDSYHWYDNGGYVMPGDTAVRNQTSQPEMLLPPAMGDTLEQIHAAVQSGGAGGVQIINHIRQQPQEDGSVLASRVSAQTHWDMITKMGGGR